MFVDRLDRLLAIGLENTHALQDPHYKNLDGFEIAAETFSERALSVQLSIEGALSIGSLVSIRKTDVLAYHRCLGVVCNLSLSKQHSRLIFETSVIAEQSFSVSYRYQDANDDGEQHKALLYGKKIGDDERSYIILESFMVKNGDILRMYMGHESFPIILNRRSNIGLGYWQFECRRILEKPGSLQEKKKGYDFI